MAVAPTRDRSRSRRRSRRWLIAIALAVAAIVVRPLATPWLGTHYIYALALPAVAVSGWVGGFGPGMLTALATVAGYAVLVFTGSLESGGFPTLTALFLPISLLFAYLGEQRRKARAAAKALATAYNELDVLLNNTPLIVIIGGYQGTITRWSGRAEALFGYSAAEMLGKTVAETGVLHPDDVAPAAAVIHRLLLGEDHVISRHRCITRDGRVLICDWYSSTVKDAKGRVRSILTLGLDVTEQERAGSELRAADETKNRFLAVLAHELRNPLAPLRNAVPLLRSGVDGENLEWVAASIERQVGQMSHLLDDLLDVSRITRNRLALQRRVFALQESIANACEQTRAALDASGQRLVLEVPTAPLYVDGDPARLTQVFANLLANAARYALRPAAVHVTALGGDDTITVRVRDEGIGISATELERIFEMFTQVGGDGASAGGLGIGLSLVRGITEMHGGSVRAESEGPGCGSTFTVTLPCAPQP